ncbi:MAG: NAD(+) diphosphatase [Rhizobiaceae bacterium]
MPRSFLDPNYTPTETSAQLAYSGNRLDRLSEEREEDCVEKALANPAARAFGIARGRVLISFDKEMPRGLMKIDELAPFSPKIDRAVLLGFDGGAPRLAIPLGINPDDENFELPDGLKAIDYRSLAAQSLLADDELGQVAQGAAYLAWHSSARFCGRCGSATQMQGGGVKRHCSSCEREYFPRTDPVVIMLITRGDKCLLGRSPHFPPRVYSTLAGFVEAGETIETAVRRETFEESGIRIGDVRYLASQPWPFPHTLMIGCYGDALEDEIVKDDGELEDCRWFSRTEVRDILAGMGPVNKDGEPQFYLPPKMAIANRLVSDWVAAK